MGNQISNCKAGSTLIQYQQGRNYAKKARGGTSRKNLSWQFFNELKNFRKVELHARISPFPRTYTSDMWVLVTVLNAYSFGTFSYSTNCLPQKVRQFFDHRMPIFIENYHASRSSLYKNSNLVLKISRIEVSFCSILLLLNMKEV